MSGARPPSLTESGSSLACLEAALGLCYLRDLLYLPRSYYRLSEIEARLLIVQEDFLCMLNFCVI
jgi:hypothetical protein